MSYGLARARYAEETAETVSPARLLIMLWDRLVLDLLNGEEAMVKGDLSAVADTVGNAQEILLEFRASLDTSAWPEGAGLGDLYLWMVQELIHARSKSEPARIAAVRALVEPLRDTWRQAAAQVAVAAGSQGTA